MDENIDVTILKLITRINILKQFLKAGLINESKYQTTKSESEKNIPMLAKHVYICNLSRFNPKRKKKHSLLLLFT